MHNIYVNKNYENKSHIINEPFCSGITNFYVSYFTDGFESADCYGMPGRSPNSQFSYPAFTFPGNGGVISSGQVILLIRIHWILFSSK